MSSYCGLVDAKLRASDKDLPVQKHIISAHDGGPYECSECSDTFTNKALFKAHFLAHLHNKNLSDLPDEVMLNAENPHLFELKRSS